MSKEWSRSLETKTNYVLKQYVEIVNDFFPGVVSIEEFIEAFNNRFTRYQKVIPRKMDPASLREGAASCSSFAALFGTWLAREFPQYSPIYLLEVRSVHDAKVHETERAKTKSHVRVAIPTKGVVSVKQAIELITKSSEAEQLGVLYKDWPPKGKLNPNPSEPGEYPLFPFDNMKSFTKNRVRTFGLPAYYSTTRGILVGK